MTYIYEKGYIIADILTFLRLIISLFLFVLALGGRTTFDYFMSLVLFAWATDALDGYFARKSGHSGKFGSREGWVDWVFYIACFFYSTYLGYYSYFFFIGIILVNLFVYFFIKKSDSVQMSFEFIYILLSFRVLYQESPLWTLVVVGWTGFIIAFKWNRLKDQILYFFRGWK